MHVQFSRNAAHFVSTKKIPTWKNKGNVTTFLALMATSEPLGAKFRPIAPFKMEEKQRRRERVGAIRLCRGVPFDQVEVGMVFQSYARSKRETSS